MMQTLMADLRLWHGRLDEALASAEQARTRFRRLGDKFGMVQALSALIRIQVALGRTAGVQRTTEELLSLADGSPAGPVPLLAVAGAAMHRGDAKVALSMVVRAEESMVERAAGSFEVSLLHAIAAAQSGLIDDALAALDEVPESAREHPFARAAAALVETLAGDHAAALRDAELVVTTHGSTYLDRAIAAVAAAGAHGALCEREAASEAIDQALQECLVVGDVVAIALLQRTHARVVGTEHASGAGDSSVLGDGWAHVIDQLPAPEHAT
jgi:tetratricopeptide (TPR) repeat protein